MKALSTRLLWALLSLPFCLFSQQAQFHQGLKIEAIPQGNAFKFRLANPPKLNAPTKNQPYLSYFWDFGDGSFKRGNVDEPVHSYAKAGTYTVRALIFTGNTLDLLEQPPTITVSPSTSSRGEPMNQSANLMLTDIALGYEGFRVGLRYTYPIVKTRADYLQIYSYYKF